MNGVGGQLLNFRQSSHSLAFIHYASYKWRQIFEGCYYGKQMIEYSYKEDMYN
jgi:hypothetical protein